LKLRIQQLTKVTAGSAKLSKPAKLKTSQGFSMVELIVAIVVGTLLTISANTAINTYLHLGKSSRNLILANSYVEGKVESLRNIGYNGLAIGTTSLTGELPSGLQSPHGGSLQVSNSSTGLKQIDISVTYTDRGVSQTYSYTTLIGELGVGQ
jgi:prepilin-type N-terminal cleavage/methylation domain-containing protein